jgi:long-chain acyl-CoA synthetase
MESTLNQVFRNRADKYGDRFCVEKKLKGKWETATWREYYERARNTGLGLYEFGITKGDMVAILSQNRLEWIYTDMGALGIGACVIPIYATVTSDEVEYVLKNSNSKVIVVENADQLGKINRIKANCPSLQKTVVIDTDGCVMDGHDILSFSDLMVSGRKKLSSDPGLFEKLADQVGPDDLATFQYTSGTTGIPKGAIHTHGTLMAELRALDAAEPKYGYESDHVVGFLPLSHIFERVPVHFYVMYKGITKSYAESIETVAADIQEKKPTILFAVPRVLEKIYQKMLFTISEKPPIVQKLFAWAQGVGDLISRYSEEKKSPPFGLRIKHKIAYALVFKKLQHALGGRIRWMCAAGAPISREIVNFFNAAGIFVLEGYGLSEVAGGATLSNLDDFKPGSVGKPLVGFDIKIAADGEILIKGDMLFRGYWKLEEETKRAFDNDGYFMTGDVGMFDEKGFLFITDRKKDLIITSGGKNVAPMKIEGLVKENPLFAQAVVVGERKNYLSALLNLNYEIAAQIAKANNIKFNSPRELATNGEFLKIVNGYILNINEKLARYENIRKFKILENDFSQESGELTVSLKVKRSVIQNKYKGVIEEIYADKDGQK